MLASVIAPGSSTLITRSNSHRPTTMASEEVKKPDEPIRLHKDLRKRARLKLEIAERERKLAELEQRPGPLSELILIDKLANMEFVNVKPLKKKQKKFSLPSPSPCGPARKIGRLRPPDCLPVSAPLV